ncbi:TniQ family protein [Ruegeria sp.]|uniref:TniQ family protein n=1 Tax=Ruegeria sp. TaxID=1879320 RepID=UPI00231E17D8|nr:TniQ family protein [Ruegeria sp.]MDA7963925.1 TniQ family protein [Ruegeria sp.]
MQVLPILISLMSGETPASFASRLAWANGLSFASEFCTDQGFTLQAIADGDERALSILAQLGGVELAQLMCGVVCKVSIGQYRLAGQLIEKRWITRRRLRFCPVCVVEDIMADTAGGAAQRCAWHVPSIRTCSHHQVRLYDDDSYSHSRGPHDFAGRIRDLNLGTDQLRDLGASQVSNGLEEYLTRRLAGEQQGTWLDNIGFGAVALGAEIFGVVDLFGIDAKLKHLSDAEKRRAGARGFELLSEGEERVFHLLRRLHREAGSPISLSRRNYGCLFNWLEQSHAEQYEPLRDLVRKFFVETYPIGKGEPVLGKPCAARRVHSVETLRRDLGLGRRQTVELLGANGFLKPEGQVGNSAKGVVLDAQALAPLVKNFAGAICQVAAQKKINAPRAQFGALVAGGIIRPIAGSPAGQPYYDEKQLDTFLASIAPRTTMAKADGLVGIQSVCRKAVAGAVDVVRLIQNGELKTVVRDVEQDGYLSVLLDPREVAEALRLIRPDGYLRSTLAEFLGVNASTLRHLVDKSHLKMVRARHPVSRKSVQVVPYSSVDRFLERYIPAKHYAEFLGGSTRKVGDQLIKERVPFIQMPEECGGRIFRRSEVTSGVEELANRLPLSHDEIAWPEL